MRLRSTVGAANNKYYPATYRRIRRDPLLAMISPVGHHCLTEWCGAGKNLLRYSSTNRKSNKRVIHCDPDVRQIRCMSDVMRRGYIFQMLKFWLN